MTSKRFEETKLEHIVVEKALRPQECIFECSTCKHQFDYQDVVETDREPAYCPRCGRKNSDV